MRRRRAGASIIPHRAKVTPGGGSGSVLVTTIHQAKGLEWPVVYLPFMTEGSLPLLPACLPPHSKEMLEHIEEERRIAYVGFTRARHQLVLSWSDVVGADGGGAAAGGNKENTAAAGAAAPAKRSRFLFGLQTTVGASGATFLVPASPPSRATGS